MVDSKKDLALSVNKTLSKLKLNNLAEELVISFIGEGLNNLLTMSIKQATKQDPRLLIDDAVKIFKGYYKNHLLDNTYCYRGVIDTLKQLSKFKKGIVTNKYKEFALDILKGLNIDSYFSVVLGGDDVNHKKPDPEMINKALLAMKVDKQKAIIIGDSFADIESANNAGIDSCFVSYGIGKLKDVKPLFSVSDIRDIINILE